MTCKQKKIESKDQKVVLKINDQEIPMVPFVHNALRDMIVAFTDNLKGHSGGKIEIVIE